LLDYLLIFVKRKKTIFTFLVIFGGMASLYSIFAPKIYKAECRILPPSRNSTLSMASVLSAQFGLGDLVEIDKSNTGALMIGILRGQTIVDRIIDQFDLMALHRENSRYKMRELVVSGILQTEENVKDGIVTVAILDEDPAKAALMANAFIEELQKALQTFAIGLVIGMLWALCGEYFLEMMRQYPEQALILNEIKAGLFPRKRLR
jgi:uncharacterized protein involved in exopolysaccharide biosynthesis